MEENVYPSGKAKQENEETWMTDKTSNTTLRNLILTLLPNSRINLGLVLVSRALQEIR